ncbi:winged helix-turn-helix transcriptional regulator [Phytohabitans kaempferiae]|uniref:Winged-helix domain-containing protein n=1 Tax=Phytohabitans kaempferiae TaxID=1620943 RepID=A0ABV6MC86_9ACTN
MKILLLTDGQTDVLPPLGLLAYSVYSGTVDYLTASGRPSPDVIVVDARVNLADARANCRRAHAARLNVPLIAVVNEAGLVAVSPEWLVDDVVLDVAGPAEIDARLRLAVSRRKALQKTEGDLIRAADLTIDTGTYTAKLHGEQLPLTFKEFELLKYLAQRPGRVFSRSHLLREVWGYDYVGGTRTVDVHIRRLRAKLGPHRESMIGTVRQVGYTFAALAASPTSDAQRDDASISASQEPSRVT